MPLQDNLPQIDDRQYDDIVTEIRTRVARYAPEWRPGESAWTDLNENDPGITLAQVYAWQAEMLLYRLNRVPALSYLKFLELIGIELNAAQPSLAQVTLPVKANFLKPTVGISARTQLTADPGDGGPPLIFETLRGMTVFRASLASVYASDGNQFLPVTDENTAAKVGFEPFGPRPDVDAALLLGFDDTGPLKPGETIFPAGEVLDLAVVTVQQGARRQYVPCGANPRAFASAVLQWEFLTPSGWKRIDTLRDDTLALTQSGHVSLRIPASGINDKLKLLPADPQPLVWFRARLVKSQYEQAPRLLAVRTNTVEVEQAETIVDEVLGGSDGSRNQSFHLSRTPVVKGSLSLEIEQSEAGYEQWDEVEDLFGSGPEDHHYALNRSTGEVATGDGKHGAIPVAYVRNPNRNVIARMYRTGGGRRGNIGADTIKTLSRRVDGIDDKAITNLLPAHSGRDEETIDEARRRAPRSLKSRDRAVTTEDFELLAQAAGNIKRAKALPLFHPDFPEQKIPGVVSVVVVPDVESVQPTPGEGTLRSVCAYLDERRLLTTELYVIKPAYQKIEVKGEVIVNQAADSTEVANAVNAALIDYFHPLHGGEDGLGWPFGGKIFYSRVYQKVFSVPGIDSITSLVLVLDGIEHETCKDVAIAPHGLLYSDEHHVSANYQMDAEGA